MDLKRTTSLMIAIGLCVVASTVALVSASASGDGGAAGHHCRHDAVNATVGFVDNLTQNGTFGYEHCHQHSGGNSTA